MDEIEWLINLSGTAERRCAAFDGAGHVFASVIVGRCIASGHITRAIAAHPDIDPKEMGAVLSIYFDPITLSLTRRDATETIRSGFVFPRHGWNTSHESDVIDDCRAAADPDFREAFRCAGPRTGPCATPATKNMCGFDTTSSATEWLVHVLTAPSRAERANCALRAVEHDAMHPEVVLGIIAHSEHHGRAAAQILADAFERRAHPPLVLPPIII